MLSDGLRTYTWEHGRQLKCVTTGSTEWYNSYDENGIRTERTRGTVSYKYSYEGGKLKYMSVGTNKLYFTYDFAGAPLSVNYNGTEYYYVTNLQGDVVAILNAAGTAVVTYTYDAWGNPLTQTGTMSSTLGTHNPLRYRGYVYDTDTGLYYLQSRYYNPEIGRFINADGFTSTGQGILGNNMFAYCGNNPIVQKDHTGCRPVATATGVDSYWERRVSCAAMKGYDLILYGEIYKKEEMLKNLGFTATNTRLAADYYSAITLCGITTIEQEAHFLAQCYVEGNLSLLEAGYLSYAAAENYRRAQPYYPYYGAGYIQLTWDYNYQAFSEYMGDPNIYLLGPQYVASYYPWSAAGWFWAKNDINSIISNGGGVAQVTRVINGGYSNLSKREAAYALFLRMLGG